MENVKERPILFSTEMVKAILENRKSMTRRVIKPQPEDVRYTGGVYLGSNISTKRVPTPHIHGLRCPYGQIGGRLWVRERIGDCMGYVAYFADGDIDENASLRRCFNGKSNIE